MRKPPEISPGTVSRILWHFTGGPRWNPKTKKQNVSPKPAADAYENLKSILKSKEVRLGNYKETVRLTVQRRIGRKSKEKRKVETERALVDVEIESSAVCCLADIPAPHLRYHAYRYGKFAIGFYRDAVIRAGFNPVFYTLENTPVIRSIYAGFSAFDLVKLASLQHAVEAIESEVSDLEAEYEGLYFDNSWLLSELEIDLETIETAVDKAARSLQDLVAFVKTFKPEEFSSIYCEREWRSTQPYQFDIKDVAMIVLPRMVGNNSYFMRFVKDLVPRLQVPRSIPIIPWEDLVEH